MVAVAVAAGPVAAQRVQTMDAAAPAVRLDADKPAPPSAASVFLTSALVPGAGQFRLGAGRWVAYAGVEAWAWINWVDARARVDELEASYRDLAWSVARRISVGRRDDREFEYYEAMSHYNESGAFDADAAEPGVQPEETPLTFNGDLWLLAQQIFFPGGDDSIPPTDQERAAALAYYEQNAIGPQYAWSWGVNELEHEHFRSLIRRSDEAARAGTTILGVILVNHVVSAVDALITARLRGPDAKPTGLRLRGEALAGPYGVTPILVVELPTR
jgi:hypothetical protein